MSKVNRDINKIAWVCGNCGNKYGKYPDGNVSTWHNGKCGVCGNRDVPVTEPKDFSYLKNLKKKGYK